MTKADDRQLAENDIPGPGSAPDTIRINALQAMYGEDAFKSPALPYCFGTWMKQEDAKLVQILEFLGS